MTSHAFVKVLSFFADSRIDVSNSKEIDRSWWRYALSYTLSSGIHIYQTCSLF